MPTLKLLNFSGPGIHSLHHFHCLLLGCWTVTDLMEKRSLQTKTYNRLFGIPSRMYSPKIYLCWLNEMRLLAWGMEDVNFEWIVDYNDSVMPFSCAATLPQVDTVCEEAGSASKSGAGSNMSQFINRENWFSWCTWSTFYDGLTIEGVKQSWFVAANSDSVRSQQNSHRQRNGLSILATFGDKQIRRDHWRQKKNRKLIVQQRRTC